MHYRMTVYLRFRQAKIIGTSETNVTPELTIYQSDITLKAESRVVI